MRYFYFLAYFSIVFFRDLNFSLRRSFTSWVRFTPRYFTFFEATVNGSVAMTSSSACLILVYRKDISFISIFYVLCYFAGLLTISRRFIVECFVFLIYIIIYHLQITMTSLLPFLFGPLLSPSLA